MFEQFKVWYQALSPRRRMAYSVLVAIIAATVPCYCIGGLALVQGLPRQPVPAIVPTSTTLPLSPTSMPLPPTPTAAPSATPTPTTALEATPTQQSTATYTPTAMPTETHTPTPTETETMTLEPSSTPTATSTATPTVTLTHTPEATATNTPSLGGTVRPLPELLLEPVSGPAGTEITILGKYFTPYARYLLYWDVPEMPIEGVLADDVGQILGVVYQVPPEVPAGIHEVVAEQDGTVVARSPFTVTASSSE